MSHQRLPADMEGRAFDLIATFHAELERSIGGLQREYGSLDVLQSQDGPTLDLRGQDAVVLVGTNATQHDPTFVANLAHESVHLHLSDWKSGNASGLEEGFALHFELATVEARYGSAARKHFEQCLPRSYVVALRDYLRLLDVEPNAARHVRDSFGKLTGPTCGQIRSMFPTISWWMCYRLAWRKRMRPG